MSVLFFLHFVIQCYLIVGEYCPSKLKYLREKICEGEKGIKGEE